MAVSSNSTSIGLNSPGENWIIAMTTGGIVAMIEPTVGMKFSRNVNTPHPAASFTSKRVSTSHAHTPVAKLIRVRVLKYWLTCSDMELRIFLTLPEFLPKALLTFSSRVGASSIMNIKNTNVSTNLLVSAKINEDIFLTLSLSIANQS